jgi:CspA family cold shock protein
MNKHRDRHNSRRNHFDGEHETVTAEPKYFERRSPAPPASAPAAGASPALEAEAVWFNPDKGFGFVRLRDGSEAFLHVSKLEAQVRAASRKAQS